MLGWFLASNLYNAAADNVSPFYGFEGSNVAELNTSMDCLYSRIIPEYTERGPIVIAQRLSDRLPQPPMVVEIDLKLDTSEEANGGVQVEPTIEATDARSF